MGLYGMRLYTFKSQFVSVKKKVVSKGVIIKGFTIVEYDIQV
jgi:hypothetical protein